ncbi:MAG: F0F1 ATP synthase subunit gamma [Caulobacteraceae bacterium]
MKATQKITKAMQMVAAAKLRRAQDAAQNARPYASRMAAVIANLAASVSGPGAPAAAGRHRFADQGAGGGRHPPTAVWPAASTLRSCGRPASTSPARSRRDARFRC